MSNREPDGAEHTAHTDHVVSAYRAGFLASVVAHTPLILAAIAIAAYSTYPVTVLANVGTVTAFAGSIILLAILIRTATGVDHGE